MIKKHINFSIINCKILLSPGHGTISTCKLSQIPSNFHARKRELTGIKFNLEEVLEIAGAPMLVLVFVHDSSMDARFGLELSDERSKPLFISHGTKTLNPGRRSKAR